jgi:hypothetical protein
VIGSDGRRPNTSSKSFINQQNVTSIEPNPWLNSNLRLTVANQLSNISHEQLLVTNLALSRELSFVIGIALPINDVSDDLPCSSYGSTASRRARSSSSSDSKRALLFTYNLRGQLMRCVCFSAPSPTPLLTLTRDGEYALLAEGNSTVQIVRVFDLTPLYALSTNDCSVTSPLSADLSSHAPAAVRSLLLMEYRYLLVGLDNGRLLVYNIDFNRWHHQYSSRY